MTACGISLLDSFKYTCVVGQWEFRVQGCRVVFETTAFWLDQSAVKCSATAFKPHGVHVEVTFPVCSMFQLARSAKVFFFCHVRFVLLTIGCWLATISRNQPFSFPPTPQNTNLSPKFPACLQQECLSAWRPRCRRNCGIWAQIKYPGDWVPTTMQMATWFTGP